MVDGTLILRKNAKDEEIKAYNILKDILFKNDIAIIGDNISKNLPDIYTKDFDIGVEVTSCEHLSQFLLDTFSKNHKKKGKNVNEIIKLYENLSLKEKNLLFLNEFEKILEKKIKKIDVYKHCKSLNLIIISNLETKSYVRRESLAEIYQKLVLKYNKKYDNLFLFYNNTLYVSINYNFVKLKKINTLSEEK